MTVRGLEAHIKTMEKRVIEASRSKTLLLVTIGLGFVALGAYFLALDPAAIESRGRSPLLIYAVGIASVVFFGLCTAAGIWRLFSSKPGLVVSPEGIEMFGMGESTVVPWRDISGFSLYKVQGQKMLVLNLYEPEKYLEAGGGLRRRLAKANYGLCGSPMAISTSSLELSFKELHELCEEYLQRHS